jgi:hypothetical protein
VTLSRPFHTLVLLALALLGGCVSFEHAPTDTLGCDPALVGTWQGTSKDGETQSMRLDDQCTVTGTDQNGQTETHAIRTTRLDDQHYIVMAADRPSQVMDSEGKVVDTWPETRVDLFRYRLDGDRLLIWMADPEVARRIASPGVSMHSDAMIDAKTGKPVESLLPSSLLLRGKREALAALLRTHGDALFSGLSPDKAVTLDRVPDAPTP